MKTVNKEISHALYELGYDGPDSGMFWVDIRGKLTELVSSQAISEYGSLLYELERVLPAPFALDVLEWLRVRHGMHVWAEPSEMEIAGSKDVTDPDALIRVLWVGWFGTSEDVRGKRCSATVPHDAFGDALHDAIADALGRIRKTVLSDVG